MHFPPKFHRSCQWEVSTMTVKCRPLVTCRGESSPASPAMTGSNAPGRAVWDLERLLLFNGYREFGVVNRPEGNKLTVRVIRPPGKKTSH